MKFALQRLYPLIILISASMALTGCFNLRPVEDPARYFVLSGITDAPEGDVHTKNLGVGIGPMSLASYLDNNRLAVRRASHEIDYADNRLWAERLDKSIPRVLSLNLARLLHSDRIQFESWSRREVRYELHVAMHRFEWDESGQAVLEAQWQMREPGAEKMTIGRTVVLQGNGPSVTENPEAAVATLNDLLAQLSRQIALELRKLTLPQ